MFRGLFSADNPVVRFFGRIGMIWLLDLMFLLTSIPLVTMGASFTALTYACMKLQMDEGEPISNYLHSFKENLKQATAIWLIYVLAGAMLVSGFVFWNQADSGGLKLGWAVVLALTLLYVISITWVFAIQSRFVNTIQRTIAYSFLLPFRHVKETIMILIMVMALVYVNLTTIVLVNFATLSFGIGAVCYLNCFFYREAFRKYIPDEEPIAEESEEADDADRDSIS